MNCRMTGNRVEGSAMAEIQGYFKTKKLHLVSKKDVIIYNQMRGNRILKTHMFSIARLIGNIWVIL